jgi:hypothetical protein
MATMPSPVDLRIWFLSRVLGWPQRRIAKEVDVSQPTVARTLERLTNDPPTDQEMQDFVAVTSPATPPKGMRVLNGKHRDISMLTWVLTGAVILITLAVTVVLFALAVAILSH